MQDVRQLIDALLTRDLMPETRGDLEEFRRELAKGGIPREDEAYVRALHARLLGDGTSPPAAVEFDEEEEPSGELAELRRQIAERDARIDELERELAALRSTSGAA